MSFLKKLNKELKKYYLKTTCYVETLLNYLKKTYLKNDYSLNFTMSNKLIKINLIKKGCLNSFSKGL